MSASEKRATAQRVHGTRPVSTSSARSDQISASRPGQARPPLQWRSTDDDLRAATGVRHAIAAPPAVMTRLIRAGDARSREHPPSAQPYAGRRRPAAQQIAKTTAASAGPGAARRSEPGGQRSEQVDHSREGLACSGSSTIGARVPSKSKHIATASACSTSRAACLPRAAPAWASSVTAGAPARRCARSPGAGRRRDRRPGR